MPNTSSLRTRILKTILIAAFVGAVLIDLYLAITEAATPSSIMPRLRVRAGRRVLGHLVG